MNQPHDIDGRVQATVADLIGQMRARRLGRELPPPPDAAPAAEVPQDDDSGDQAALEAMLNVE